MKTSISKVAARALASAAVTFTLAAPSHASDHYDGPKTTLDNAADVADVYAFVSPSDPRKLVVIMNVHGLAFGGSRFSNRVDYRIRIRPIDDPRTLVPSPDPRRERSIVCTFSGGLPLVSASQRATCRFDLLDGVETISFDTRSNEYRGGGAGERNGIRVFAGVRSDPFFLDVKKILKFNAGIPFSGPGLNGLWGQNVLSIVAEVDKARLPGPLLAVTGQTIRK